MITEDYVSFEIAKLLKEKGFDCASEVWYSEYTSQFVDKKYINIEFDNHNKFNENYKFICSAPTLQMARKWLRKVHNINIDIVSIWNQKRFEYQVFVVTPENAKHCYIDDKLYLGYEEAAEAGIKYCLENLI
jgi:hypothetical protein